MNDQQRIETAADNCEVLRARLARYEDAEGRPLQFSFPAEFLEHVKHARKELCRKETAPFHVRQRLAQKLTDCIAALKSQLSGVVLPEREVESVRDGYRGLGHAEGFNACLDEVARLNSSPVSAGVSLSGSRAGRVYIAGPMTGYENYNFAAFNAEADRLRAQGLHVENPADHGVVDGADWADYLRYDIGRLATCERIHLLPGWSKSKGARLEVHIAKALGVHVWYAEGAEDISSAPSHGEQVRHVVPSWMASARTFVDRLHLAGWRDHADAQHAGVAGMYDELLAAAPSLASQKEQG